MKNLEDGMKHTPGTQEYFEKEYRPPEQVEIIGDLLDALSGMLENYIELKKITLIMARSDCPNWMPGLTPEDDVHVIAARAAIKKAREEK